MAKQRFPIAGGSKFKSYEDAKQFKETSTVCTSVQAPDVVQIRKTEFGYKVVVRREVTK